MPESPGGQAWHLFWDLYKANRLYFEAVAAEFELTPQTMYALKFLCCEETPVPMSELAGLLTCDASSVTAIADRLETHGLAERRSAPNDRRVKGLVLTACGLSMQRRIFERMQQPPPCFANLSLADQVTLRDILQRALDHVDPADAAANVSPFQPGRQATAEPEPIARGRRRLTVTEG